MQLPLNKSHRELLVIKNSLQIKVGLRVGFKLEG